MCTMRACLHLSSAGALPPPSPTPIHPISICSQALSPCPRRGHLFSGASRSHPLRDFSPKMATFLFCIIKFTLYTNPSFLGLSPTIPPLCSPSQQNSPKEPLSPPHLPFSFSLSQRPLHSSAFPGSMTGSKCQGLRGPSHGPRSNLSPGLRGALGGTGHR